MRRAEMARRRKNLSEKRNEEEKVRLVSLTDLSPVTTITSAITQPPFFSLPHFPSESHMHSSRPLTIRPIVHANVPNRWTQ